MAHLHMCIKIGTHRMLNDLHHGHLVKEFLVFSILIPKLDDMDPFVSLGEDIVFIKYHSWVHSGLFLLARSAAVVSICFTLGFQADAPRVLHILQKVCAISVFSIVIISVVVFNIFIIIPFLIICNFVFLCSLNKPPHCCFCAIVDLSIILGQGAVV